MRTLLHPFLPNGPAGDPALWVDLLDEGCSALIDLGDLRRISNRKLLRVDRVVVSHTHMDHFIGFDQLLRVILGREKELVITGPPGFIDHVGGRLRGYTWNLIESYPVRLIAEEVDGDTIRSAVFSGPGRLRPEPGPDRPWNGTLHAHRAYTIHADLFDHGIPVLGVALRETEHLAVDKDRLTKLGFVPGEWLAELKLAGASHEVITVPGALEIPAAIAIAIDAAEANGKPYDAAIALGCVVRGDTIHFEIVSQESSRGLMDLAVSRKFPLGNGILTVNTEAQAWARARASELNKGGDAARAAIAMLRIKRRLAKA